MAGWKDYINGPDSAAKIRRGKNCLNPDRKVNPYKSWESIVGAIAGLNPDEYLVVYRETSLLPIVSDFSQWSQAAFRKRFTSIDLGTLETQQLVSERVTPSRLLECKFREFTEAPEDDYGSTSRRGVTWTWKEDGMVRLYTLADVVNALMKLSASLEVGYDYKFKARGQDGSGVVYDGTVVSKEAIFNPVENKFSDKTYKVNLRRPQLERKNASWVGLISWSDVRRGIYAGQYMGKDLGQVTFGDHEIELFWYSQIVDKFSKVTRDAEGRTVRKEFDLETIIGDPFVKPSTGMIDFDWKMKNNVIREHEIVKKDGTKAVGFRQLLKVERQNLHTHFIYHTHSHSPAVIISNDPEETLKLVDYVQWRYSFRKFLEQ